MRYRIMSREMKLTKKGRIISPSKLAGQAVRERSCGAIVFLGDEGEERVLLVQHNPGHWSFPKGHVEEGESDRETAVREVLEETGLHVRISSDFERSSTYSPRQGIYKTVVFFLGDLLGGTLKPQLSEVKAADWLTIKEADKVLIFDRDREIFKEALDYHRQKKASQEIWR